MTRKKKDRYDRAARAHKKQRDARSEQWYRITRNSADAAIRHAQGREAKRKARRLGKQVKPWRPS